MTYPGKFRLVQAFCGLLLFASPVKAVASPAASRRAPINVILITIDTVRADHLSCYGYKSIQTPTLDALAHDGIVFDRAIAQVPLTWPSHTVIFTGMYPFQNGVQDFTGQPLAPQFRSVAQAFREHGYATGAVVSAFVLDRSWGLARGFDSYDDTFSAGAFSQQDLGLVDRKAAESVSRAIAWLQNPRKGPFFFWLHLYDPHSPYDPPEPFRSQYRDRPYDGEIAYADHELGRLIGWLRTRHLYDSSLIVFASDHGESLGEHGESEHGLFIYNSTTWIPLIVKPPAGSRIEPNRVQQPVESVSIGPTLLALAGIHDRIEKQFQARDLFRKPAPEEPAYSETLYPLSSFGWSPLHGLESGRYHYIDAPRPELYDLVADPGESKNLAADQPATVSVLRQNLQQRLGNRPFEGSKRTAADLTPDTAEKLRALGYVAYSSPVSAEVLAKGLADPKDKLEEFNSFLKASDALRAGNFDHGERLLRDIAERDPQVSAVPFVLGEAAIRQQKWDAAASFMKRAIELSPNFDQAMTGLAHATYAQGNAPEARQWLEKALQVNPQNYRAWFELAQIRMRSDPTEATRAFEKTLEIQPNFAPGQFAFGVFNVHQKHYAQALQHLHEARNLGVEDARIFNYMGICYSQLNELQKAIDSFHQAIGLDANLAEAHLNLGYAYERQNAKRAAASEYATACRLESRFCASTRQTEH